MGHLDIYYTVVMLILIGLPLASVHVVYNRPMNKLVPVVPKLITQVRRGSSDAAPMRKVC